MGNLADEPFIVKVTVNVCRPKKPIFGFFQISETQLLRNTKIPSLEVTDMLNK